MTIENANEKTVFLFALFYLVNRKSKLSAKTVKQRKAFPHRNEKIEREMLKIGGKVAAKPTDEGQRDLLFETDIKSLL